MNHTQLKSLYKRVTKTIADTVIIWLATKRMKVGIQAVNALHKFNAKKGKYLDCNNRVLRNYIVLLEMPIKDKKGKVSRSIRLFWINRNNFKRIKRQGWLPWTLHLDQLRKQAFYVSNPNRSHNEEYRAREKAIDKYITYIKYERQC